MERLERLGKLKKSTSSGTRTGHLPACSIMPQSRSNIPTLVRRQTNWHSFRTYIEQHVNLKQRIRAPKEMDEATQYFTAAIEEAAWYSARTPEAGRRTINNIPLHIRELVTEKRRAQTRWQNSRNNDDRLIYNTTYRLNKCQE
jgi:hypothetical protein